MNGGCWLSQLLYIQISLIVSIAKVKKKHSNRSYYEREMTTEKLSL